MMADALLSVDLDSRQAFHHDRLFPITNVFDAEGNETDSQDDAAMVVFGEDGVGWWVFHLERGCFISGETPEFGEPLERASTQ
jgi:hypothetical protein